MTLYDPSTHGDTPTYRQVGTYPTHPNQLSNEWLTAALRADGHLGEESVQSFSTTPIGEGIGMLGILVRVALTYDLPAPHAPASLVAKFTTPIAGNRAVGMAFKLYEREIGFYRTIAPTVAVAAPRSYFGAIDPETGDSVLLLEDLSGYRVGDQVTGCTAAEAVMILDAVAPLHARYWGRPEEMPLTCVPHVDSDSQIDGIAGGCQVGWDPCVAQFGHVIAPEIKAARDRFIASVPELHRRIGQRSQTVIHGDVRLDNLMFGVTADQPPVVMLDWAMMKSNVMHDVAYLLTQNVTIEERRAHETELIEHHHLSLVNHGVSGYSIEQAWADYHLAALYLFCYAVVIGGTLDGSNARGAAFMERLIERSSTTLMDHDLMALLPDDAPEITERSDFLR